MQALTETDGYLSSREVLDVAQISYRQLDYWVRTELIRPSVIATGSGTYHQFSSKEVSLLCAAADLVRAGVSLQAVRALIPRIAAFGDEPWQLVLRDSVWSVEPRTEG